MNEQRADLVILPGLNNPKELLEKFRMYVFLRVITGHLNLTNNFYLSCDNEKF